MAGANARTSEEDDGILTGLEVSALDLRGTKLVVLSACQTGTGEPTIGEGLDGMRHALVLAGAEAEVISLWDVSDEATRDLMATFYRRLRRGEGRAEALRQAQLTMMSDPQWRHPSYWAAFVLSGNPGSIDDFDVMNDGKGRVHFKGCFCAAASDSAVDARGNGLACAMAAAVVGAKKLRRRARRGL